MRWLVLVSLGALGCSAFHSGTGDDDDDADAMPMPDAVPDSPVITISTNPDWPADSALPAEFDFPPYLNMLDASTVVVSWRTVNGSTGTVHFGKTPAYGTDLTDTTSANLHHVTLASLEPATAYFYQVAIDGTSATRDGVFVTPGATSWRFMHSGEFHAPSSSTNVAKYAAQIRAFRPHVLLESGDMVDVGSDLTHWRSYMRTSAPWISNVILLPAHSNHVNGTGGNALLKDLFVLPNNERWYTTRYSQVEWVSIDSTYDDNADVATDEVPWIGTRAAAAHDGVDDPTFLIAAWHYPACSSQYQSRSGERLWVYNNLVKAFTDNGGVDMILAAHDKYYERSTITGGIVHVITNIGNISPAIAGSNNPACTPEKTIRTTRSTMFVNVDDKLLSAKMFNETGTEIDAVSIMK
ncbi:MAG TPA: fibronectin type III domain-containing protein [Kofleriaceae bacterium]|nr:fibronectin type III domain-containing protein [Kofleriaceae bacterium]